MQVILEAKKSPGLVAKALYSQRCSWPRDHQKLDLGQLKEEAKVQMMEVVNFNFGFWLLKHITIMIVMSKWLVPYVPAVFVFFFGLADSRMRWVRGSKYLQGMGWQKGAVPLAENAAFGSIQGTSLLSN